MDKRITGAHAGALSGLFLEQTPAEISAQLYLNSAQTYRLIGALATMAADKETLNQDSFHYVLEEALLKGIVFPKDLAVLTRRNLSTISRWIRQECAPELPQVKTMIMRYVAQKAEQKAKMEDRKAIEQRTMPLEKPHRSLRAESRRAVLAKRPTPRPART